MNSTSTMTKREAKAHFLAVSVPEGLNDKPAMRYAWGVYTDLLCKEGCKQADVNPLEDRILHIKIYPVSCAYLLVY